MADAGKTIGGSPWDEPLPENTKAVKPTPSVVGDLDVNKNVDQTSQSAEQKPAELKIPTDTEEKVGAKVDIASAPPSTPTNVPVAENQNPNVATPPAAIPVKTIPVPEPVSPQPQPQNPAPESQTTNSNFWQSVYGEEGSPDGAVPVGKVGAQTAGTTAVSKKIAPDIQPEATIQISNIKPVENTPSQPAPKNIAAVTQVPIRPVTKPAVQQPSPQAPRKPMPAANRTNTLIIAGILGLIIIFAGGVFLTEKGLISFGLEKIYGAIRLEALWGGLPANAENAFAMSAAKMKSEKSYKISGNATLTVNKGIKSNLISPIVSAAALPVLSLKDEQIGPKINAVLAATTDQTSTSSNDLFQSGNSSTTGQSDTSSQSTSSTVPTSSLTAVEEITTDINARIADSVSGTKINVKSSKSSDSEIQLIYSKNKLYVKSSADIVYDSKAKGGWVAFDLNKFGTDSPGQTFLGSNFSGSNFSIVGGRSASETVGGVRCFHYSGKATIGSALESFGLKEDSITSLDVDYWLGTSDHLIHRLSMKIIPGSKSAVSRIDISLDFSEFGTDSSDFIVPASSSPYSGSTTASGQPTPGDTNLTPEKTRDTQRKADLANIAKALESYRSAQGKYPEVSGSEKISSSVGVLSSALVPKYLSVMPLDPNDPTNYYGYESNGTTYKLSCVLEDKTDKSGKSVGSVFLYFLSSL